MRTGVPIARFAHGPRRIPQLTKCGNTVLAMVPIIRSRAGPPYIRYLCEAGAGEFQIDDGVKALLRSLVGLKRLGK
eukprot:scaffold501_cov105-Isochrysis_galbana.AAC.12